MSESKSLRAAYGDALVKFGGENPKIVVLDADLSNATMTNKFAAKYPERFFDYGIAEANMVCAAAGLAFEGFIPFVSTFALFGTGRAFEQIRNSVVYPGANVKLAFTHAGISVGEDGGSHQSIEDIALMRSLPGLTIFAPCDAVEAEKAIKAAIDMQGPVYLRFSRPASGCVTSEGDRFIPGLANVLREGSDISLFAMGLMVPAALEAAAALQKEGVSAAVVNFHTLKPFDSAAAVKMAEKTGAVLTVEEHSVIGGLGSAAAEALAGKTRAKFARLGIADKFGKSGTVTGLFQEYGLTPENIASQAKALLKG